MKRRIMACVLALAMLFTGITVAFAEETYTARTPLDGSSAKRNNISLAIAAIDGTELEYGETFSFNDIVGSRTEKKGYVSATNGRGVKVVGGGVSQVATTLYLALLKLGSDVKFSGLKTYGDKFVENYVSDGDLAIVTDYSDGIDLEFTNRAGHMEIAMWLSSGYVNCSITVDDDNWFDDDTYTASIDISDNDSKTMKNVTLAAESVYDTTLAKGDKFSFNKIVGPRTEKYGYVSGTNGRGVKVTGGGVAQVASVIWLAVKDRKDISIIEKSTYGKRYNQDYVESSADAIVTDYSAGTDFSFRYNGSGSITIYTYVEGDELRCKIEQN